ncbi:MAG: hypothetical protein MPW13_12660 [Candidatus Manganitrophus sp.]|nr:hypothetical protein [Candidatus Manganitrophus sp.]
MRLKVKHQTVYRYSAPVQRSVQTLRLTPDQTGSSRS